MAYSPNYLLHLDLAKNHAKHGRIVEAVLHYHIAGELGDFDYCQLCIDIVEGRKAYWSPTIIDWPNKK